MQDISDVYADWEYRQDRMEQRRFAETELDDPCLDEIDEDCQTDEEN